MTASASAPAQRSGVIAPYGGTLVDLMVAEVDRAAVKATATKTIECSDRNACDVELLCVGGLSPLRGFMHQEDYDAMMREFRVLRSLRHENIVGYLHTTIVGADEGKHRRQQC